MKLRRANPQRWDYTLQQSYAAMIHRERITIQCWQEVNYDKTTPLPKLNQGKTTPRDTDSNTVLESLNFCPFGIFLFHNHDCSSNFLIPTHIIEVHDLVY